MNDVHLPERSTENFPNFHETFNLSKALLQVQKYWRTLKDSSRFCQIPVAVNHQGKSWKHVNIFKLANLIMALHQSARTLNYKVQKTNFVFKLTFSPPGCQIMSAMLVPLADLLASVTNGNLPLTTVCSRKPSAAVGNRRLPFVIGKMLRIDSRCTRNLWENLREWISCFRHRDFWFERCTKAPVKFIGWTTEKYW